MPWVNVLYLLLTATTHVAADLKSIVDSLVASWATQFAPVMSNNYFQTQAKASWLYASGNSLEYTGSYSNEGSVAGAEATEAACYVINWAITDFYRGGHPRTYLPGVPQTYITAGRVISASHLPTVAANANSFLTAVNALTHGGISAVALGTVRYASGNAWLSPPVFRPYQSASVRAILGTQRRRLGA